MWHGLNSIAANSHIVASFYKIFIMKYLTVSKGSDTVMYGNKDYRIQNDRGYKHIVVYIDGRRTKITVKEREPNCVFDYIFGGGSVAYPCPAMDYWIYRFTMGKRITPADYKIKFNIKNV